jgi:hypothetical protein
LLILNKKLILAALNYQSNYQMPLCISLAAFFCAEANRHLPLTLAVI